MTTNGLSDKLPISFKIWLLFSHTNIFWVLLRVEHILYSFTKLFYYYYVPKSTQFYHIDTKYERDGTAVYIYTDNNLNKMRSLEVKLSRLWSFFYRKIMHAWHYYKRIKCVRVIYNVMLYNLNTVVFSY